MCSITLTTYPTASEITAFWYSVYLLYLYKSTNTDAAGALARGRRGCAV
jgi:hypothetical protein